MKNSVREIIAITIILAISTACAHSNHPRGSVVIKHSDSEVDICLGEKEVQIGDRLSLYEYKCKSEGTARQRRTKCTKIQVGEGEVTQILDEHYSTMKVSPGASFGAGTLVEKL